MSEAPLQNSLSAPRSKLATASLVVGVLSILLCGGGILGIVACWMGVVGLRRIDRSGGALGGRALARGGVITGGIGVVLSLCVAALFLYQNNAQMTESSLDAAEKELFTQTGGQVAFGNTPEARELATKMISGMEAFTATMSEKPTGLSILGDSFLASVWRSPRGTAFLVTVPNLNKYSDAAQEAIFAASWNEAQRLMREAGAKDGTGLAVAPRGTLAYERILIGELSADPVSAANPLPGVTRPQATEKDLERFFR